MMKFPLFSIVFVTLLLAVSCNQKSGDSGSNSDGSINWIDIPTADNIKNDGKKMYFIDMYTDWCGWCKVMDKKTFSDPQVAKYMSNNFHMIKFNAEQRESVTFDNKEYGWLAGGRNGIHQLALTLLNGQLSYPSYVYLDANKKPIGISAGFMEPAPFMNEVKRVIGR